MKNEVVYRGKWTAIKKMQRYNSDSFDIWQWNIAKLKWTRLVNAGGFGDINNAIISAKDIDQEVDQYLKNATITPDMI